MLNVSQEVLNRLGQEPTLEYKITKHLFSQRGEEIDKALQDLQEMFEPLFQKQNPDCPASILTMWFLEILPLYLDSRAIQTYITMEEDYLLYRVLPEIISPENAVEIISRETSLSVKDKEILREAFKNSRNVFPRI